MTSTKNHPTVGIVIPAAGRGTRAGKGCQKAYRRLAGDTVINRVLKLFRSWNAACPIVVVYHPDDVHTLEASIDRDSNIHTTTGGVERQASVLEGLRFLSQLANHPSHVFIHDAARPFASDALLDSVWKEIVKEPSVAVIPAIAVADTLKKTDSNGLITATVPREGLFRAQTPQAFDLPTILNLHEQAALASSVFTDDASLFENEGLPVRVIPGEANNTKLTFSADFEQAERLLRSNSSSTNPIPDVRVGHGYDTHRLVPGDEIILCGVKIPHSASLLGHSDADVGLHALTNAFLGTIAANDIGSHFSPTESRWKGASSDVFLRHAARLVGEAGGTITHCDVSFVCEKPRISVHRDAMRDAVARIVCLDRSRVSVKAGTNEKIGFLVAIDEIEIASVDEVQQLCMNPGAFITQHSVTHKTVHKATAKDQIDEAVQEGYDFYLNFMWGTHDDSLAGVEAIRYFESLNLPSAGVQSSEREQSKRDFLAAAKCAGSPLVPGSEKYPLFVKPASSYGSMFIDEHSLCRNETELERCITRLNGLMRPVRIDRAMALGLSDPEQYFHDCESAGRDSTDIVVQEFIEGEEFSVVVIAMGESPAPLVPQRAKYKQVSDNHRFLTLDLKFDSESGYELMSEDEDPELYRHLQETAVEAFTTKKMYTNGMGCDVDMRIGRDGRAFVIEVDPLPVFFYPAGSKLEDTDVKEAFPGGYRAVVNTYITNYFLRTPGQRGSRFTELASLFDGLNTQPQPVIDLPRLVPYEGTALDLGCGTGAVGSYLQANTENNITHLVGVDISNGMLEICRQNSLYNELVHDQMQSFLSQQPEMVDHIFCVSALDFLPGEELDFVLARCFQLSRRSITLVVEDFTRRSQSLGPLDDFRTDHSEAIQTFQIPPGWHQHPAAVLNTHQEGHWLFYFQRA
ncbi:hypothetical protein BDV12DRAFT_207484 [Aspergillus spectabilis]